MQEEIEQKSFNIMISTTKLSARTVLRAVKAAFRLYQSKASQVYDKIPAERMNGIKSIGFSLEDGSIYSGMFDLMVGGEVQAEVVNHIQHYRESPLVQKAISDMKTLLEKRQASKELEERPNTRQSVREALKNRKKAQEQQSNQEQAKPKKAKKKGEMEL